MPRPAPIPLVLPLLASGLCSLFALTGCIAHTARVHADAAAGPGERMVVGMREVKPLSAGVTMTRPQPIDLAVTAWEQRGDAIVRCDEHVRTPLPWWQRFPCDAVADLLPVTYTAEVERTIVLVPAARLDDEALTQEARRHGFAHD